MSTIKKTPRIQYGTGMAKCHSCNNVIMTNELEVLVSSSYQGHRRIVHYHLDLVTIATVDIKGSQRKMETTVCDGWIVQHIDFIKDLLHNLNDSHYEMINMNKKKYIEYDIMTQSWGSEKESALNVQEAFRDANSYFGVSDIDVTDIENGFHIKIDANQYLGILYGEVGLDVKDRFKEIVKTESFTILVDTFDVDVSDFKINISDETIEKMKKWIDEIEREKYE